MAASIVSRGESSSASQRADLFEEGVQRLGRPTRRHRGAGAAIALANADDAIECIGALEGNLTGTVHVGGNDPDAPRVLQALEQSVGRVIVNGYPTGVEVNSAIVHGGPYPATTDVGSTSVGTASMS